MSNKNYYDQVSNDFIKNDETAFIVHIKVQY